MQISLTSASIQTSTTRLSQSSQVLTAQTLSKEQKSALINATPAAVYHPSEEAVTQSPPTEAVTTWVGRSQSPDFAQIAVQHKSAHDSLKSAFEDFQATVASELPELAEKKFGFSVEADGSLTVLDPSGELSASDTQRLNELMNASSDLKAAAGNYRDASIDLVDADSPWGGSYLGGYNLNKDNFSSTIDLAALFIPKGSAPTVESVAGFFSNQLWSKGEPATQESEAAMLAARSAKKAAQSA